MSAVSRLPGSRRAVPSSPLDVVENSRPSASPIATPRCPHAESAVQRCGRLGGGLDSAACDGTSRRTVRRRALTARPAGPPAREPASTSAPRSACSSPASAEPAAARARTAWSSPRATASASPSRAPSPSATWSSPPTPSTRCCGRTPSCSTTRQRHSRQYALSLGLPYLAALHARHGLVGPAHRRPRLGQRLRARRRPASPAATSSVPSARSRASVAAAVVRLRARRNPLA